MLDPATHDVVRVTLQLDFVDGVRYVTLTGDEWREYIRAHRLAVYVPFTCPATWMSPELEALLCSHVPGRQVKELE